jgi:hypothetical protein
MREHFKIITNRILRNEEIERQVMEYNRMRVVLVVMLVGSILVLVALMRG